MWAARASTALLWPHPSPQINTMLQLSLGLGRWCRSPLTPGMAVLQGQPSWHSTGFWMSGEQGEPEGHQSSSCIPPPHSQSSSPAAAAASHTEMLSRQVSGAAWRGVKPCLWKRGHTDIQECWQERGLVRQRIKQPRKQWFVQQNSQSNPPTHKHVQVGFGFPGPGMGFAAPEAAAEPLLLSCTVSLTAASLQAGPEKLHPWAHSPTAPGSGVHTGEDKDHFTAVPAGVRTQNCQQEQPLPLLKTLQGH